MNCTHPPPLSDDHLSAALDGLASVEIQTHLATCLACAARLADARKLEQRLAHTLQRWDCPTTDQLGDYTLDLISPSEARTIASHLTHCSACERELQDLQALLADRSSAAPPLPVRRSPGKRLYELVAQLITPAPELALRGDDRGPLIAVAGELMVICELRQGQSGTRELVGQLSAGAEQPRWDGALVELRSSHALVATAILDQDGGFSCPAGPLPVISLRITAADGRALLVPELDLSD